MPSALFVTTVPITLEAFLLPFADHFRSQGWRVEALANGAAEDRRIASHFDACFDAGWSRSPLAPGNLLGTPKRVRDIVTARGYDVVHVHTPVAAFVTRYALRSLPDQPAVIYTAHGFHFYRGQAALPHAVFRTMERLAAPWTDFLVTINREDLEAARAFGTISSERIRYVPGIGVDCGRFDPGSADAASRVRAELGVEGRFVLTMIAEFVSNKRHALVLDALAKVRDPRVRLVLAGDGPLEDDVRREVARRGLADRVVFAGYRRDVPALLAATDALVLASLHEGLNRSALEAMAAGVPVIGTDTRGIADAVNGDAGWIVGKDDADALASAVEAAASDPAEAKRRGTAGRERARREYSLGAVIEAYDALYREALESRAGQPSLRMPGAAS